MTFWGFFVEEFNVMSNEVLKNIFNRKSVRKFTEEKITNEQLLTIAKAGMAAASACNLQPWELVLVDEREILDSLADGLDFAKMLYQAPAAIVVCGDLSKTLDGVAMHYWSQDCAAVSQNILLATESMGLGAVWTGVYPIAERVDFVREKLQIADEKIKPFAVIALGYADGEFTPMDKFKEEKIHYNRW